MDVNEELKRDRILSADEEAESVTGERENVGTTVDTATETNAETDSEDGIQYHDRIAEAYDGLLGEDFMNRQKVRIDWICQKAEGGRILDIGCSQGTVPLLMGRSGAEVTGIDIDPEAIRYATSHLLEEPVEVQSRVRYLCGDFLAMDLPENHYDAVLLTEILEHLEEPQRFLEKAALLLKDGGRLVVTVPFGVNAHQDHKRTYYLSELYRQLAGMLTITDIAFFDGWIGFLSWKNKADAVPVPSDIGLIAREEEAFYGIEQKYRGIERNLRTDLQRVRKAREEFREKVLDLSTKLKERKETETALRSDASDLRKALTASESALRDTHAELISANTALEEKTAALEEKTGTLKEKTAALEDANEQIRKKDEALKDAGADLRKIGAELEEANAAISEKERSLTAVSEALGERETALSAAQEALEQKEADLSRLQGELREEQEALRAAEETAQTQNSLIQQIRKDLKNALGKLKKTEADLSERDRSLKDRENQLQISGKREDQLKEKNSQFSSELYQTRRKLELVERERGELRVRLDALEKEYAELMDTPAGNRAHLKLERAKFRRKRKAAKAEVRAYEGGALRRFAKRFPLLVSIVKKIRMKHPESEFLFLESSRSDFRRSKVKAPSSAARTGSSGHPVNKRPQEQKSVPPEKSGTFSSDVPKPAPVQPSAVPAPKAAEKPENKSAEKPQKAPARVMTKEQEQFIDSLRPLIDALPESNGCRYFQKSKLRIGIICDEFFFDSINAAAEFVPLEPTDWKEKLPGVDLLLIVSLWRGLHEEWKGVANITSVKREKIDAVFEMIAESKRRGIPTVFYSKEDPPNYERFVDFAKECEYVFTTAEECLPDYVRDTGNLQPRVLRFSVNPLFHNPVGFRKYEKQKAVLFSGSWMAKYPDRCKDMSMLFDGVLSSGYGLHIIDRNYPANKNYLFPPEYFPYVSPSVDHATLQKVHKLFDWAINTNSVQFSKTMFANRAYELQAAGVLLLSNYSLGVNSLLPNVFMAFSSDEVRAILSAYTPEETYERQIAGIRSVLRSDTCFDRMDELYAAVGLERQQKVRRIAVIGDPGDPETAESFARQTFPDRELLAPEEVTEEKLRGFDMAAFFGKGMRYGEFYLEDMANGFKYTACDYITKAAYLENGVLHPGTEHDYVGVMGSRFRTLFWREAFTAEALLGMADGTELPNGYSIDHFHYDAAPAAEKVVRSEPYKLSVVVPVYNNGPHLYGKCFSSLRRSSIFRDMEIILVDDGSTDGVTPKYITDLAGRYDNVRTFFFEPGGSGSASRPRNKGVELATAEYLTFLDPDNEATEDGYARLLESMENGKYELAVGYHLRAGTAVDSMSRYSFIRERLGSDSFAENKPNVVRVLRFPTISIQAAVMRRGMVLENGFEQVPGAAGQDTLFGWQLLHGARSLRFLDLCVHVYYAATAGSVTNTLNIKYFRKLWLLQEPKLEWLRSAGLLEIFMKSKYAFYTDNLIFKNLARVNAGDGEEAVRIVWDYVQLYAPYFQGSDEMIGRFSALCERGDYSGALDYVKESFASPADAPESP